MHNLTRNKSKWHSVIQKALSHERRYNRVIPNEWRGFSNIEVNILFQLADEEVSIESIIEDRGLSILLEEGSEAFLEQCLYTCLGNNKRMLDDKFLPLMHHIDELMAGRKIKYTNSKRVHHTVLLHVVEKENADALKALLSTNSLNVNDQKPTLEREDSTSNEEIDTQSVRDYMGNTEDNSDVLLNACARNNYAMVQALVSAGYR